MSVVEPKKEDYTFEEWLELDNNENIELIDGVLYMQGEPSSRHMDVVRELTVELGVFLRGKQCRLYTNPYMVKLNTKKTAAVHPDITVVCDKNKMTDRGCIGAPDLIIEILSPSNAGHDIFTKYHQYLMAGVKEYWIVDPQKNTVIAYILKNGGYEPTLYKQKDIIPVSVLSECKIDLKVIFESLE